MAKKDVDVHIRAHDRLTKTFRGARRETAGLGRSLGKLAGIAAGFFGFRFIAQQTVAAIRESVMFQKQLAEISTMLDDDIGPTMARFKTEIMAMATEFGQSKETLTKGLYDILSAGIAAGDGLTVLRVAAKGAIGGVTDTAISVDALTTVINAYGLRAEDATRVSDLMFSTVKEGKITYEELAENIGKIAPVAKAANVPLEDMFAMLATAVKVEKPERAFTAIRAALMTAAKEGKNLLGIIREMRGAKLEEILGAGFGKRAAVGVAILTGNWQALEEQIIKARNSGGKADIAFQKMADTNYQKLVKLREAWKNVQVAIGDAAVESETLKLILEGTAALLRGYWRPGRAAAEIAALGGAPARGARPYAGMQEPQVLMAGVGMVPMSEFVRAHEIRMGLAPSGREPRAQQRVVVGAEDTKQTALLEKIEENTGKTEKNTETVVEGRRF